MYIDLFFCVNKNFFFEKYNFLSRSYKKDKQLYKIWYFGKFYFEIILSVILVNCIIKIPILNNILLIFFLIGNILKIDNKDWQLFFRKDFMLEIPNDKKRFKIVLFGNLFMNLLVENNIIVIIVLLSIFLKLSILQGVGFFLIYMLSYIAIMFSYYLLQIGSIEVKRVFSFVSYIFSIFFTTIVVYLVIDFFVKFFKNFNIISKSPQLLGKLLLQIKNSYVWLEGLVFNKVEIIVLAILVIDIVVFLVTIWNVKNITIHEQYEESYKYNFHNFKLLCLIRKITYKFIPLKNDTKVYLDKEFALFASVFKYNFKDYYYVFFFDRSFSFLLAVILILVKYPFNNSYVVMLVLSAMLVITDVNSATGIKMITNLSFISDYNTLIIANSNGIDINKLLKYKISFFYIMKGFSYILLFLTIIVFTNVLGAPIWFSVLVLIQMLILVLIFPKMYIINNLIYTRINYRNYEKYLEENKILEYGVDEFLPLNCLFKVLSFILIVTIGVTILFAKINIGFTIGVSILTEAIGIPIVYSIMKRIGENIISYIEGGNYSAEFIKIFKQSSKEK